MSCNTLNVKVAPGSGLSLQPAGEVHGHVESISPSHDLVTYGNTGSYGPDAKLLVIDGGKQIALIEVQQNYCFLKSGQITSRVEAGGGVKLTNVEGSYADGKGGEVIVGK